MHVLEIRMKADWGFTCKRSIVGSKDMNLVPIFELNDQVALTAVLVFSYNFA